MSQPYSHSTPDEAAPSFDFRRLVDAARGVRLGVALTAVAWVHLVIFGFCEFLFLKGDRAPAHFLPLWVVDVAFCFVYLRPRIVGMARLGAGPSSRLLLRVWLTFAILCLTSASLNSITGFEIDWFKISWSMLGTFGFAMLAWVFHLAFLVPAILMSVTALLIAAHPDHAYLLFGIAWFATLHGCGALLEGRRLLRRWGFDPGRRERIVLKRRPDGLQS